MEVTVMDYLTNPKVNISNADVAPASGPGEMHSSARDSVFQWGQDIEEQQQQQQDSEQLSKDNERLSNIEATQLSNIF